MISIIICTYNRDRFLGSCLESLTSQSCSPSEYEIILVNNRSTDNTHQLCLDFSERNPGFRIRYFIEENQGLSFARNRGIREAEGDLLAFADDDAVLCRDYVKNLRDEFGGSGIAAGGGKILPMWEKSRPKWMSRFLLPLVSVIDLGAEPVKFSGKKYPIGANMFFRREVFSQVGLFDTRLGRSGGNLMGSEEKDIFLKIRTAGLDIVYCPDIWVYHIVPEERTKMDFVKKQARGIGKSERVRTLDSRMEWFKSIGREALKWGATFILAFFYLLGADYEKAKALVRFRYWVSKGLLFKDDKDD